MSGKACTCSRCNRTESAGESGLPEGWEAVLEDDEGRVEDDVFICSGCRVEGHLIPVEGEGAFLHHQEVTFHLTITARPDPDKGVGLGSGTWWEIEQGSAEDGSLNSFGFDSLDLAISFLEDELRRYEKGSS